MLVILAALIHLAAVDDVSIDRARLETWTDGDRVNATLTIVLSLPAQTPRALEVPIRISSGGRITGMHFEAGRELPRHAGELRHTDDARAYYDAVVARRLDAALLRHDRSIDAVDHYALHVHPVSRTQLAAVEIELTLPRDGTVYFVSAPRIERFDLVVEGTAQRLWHVTRPHVIDVGYTTRRSPRELDVTLALAPRTHPIVAAERALYAGPRVTTDVPPTKGAVAPLLAAHDELAIEARLIAHADELQRCIARGRSYDPDLPSDGELALSIAADGLVIDMAFDAEFDPLSRGAPIAIRCVRDVIERWALRRSGRARKVRFAIDLGSQRWVRPVPL